MKYYFECGEITSCNCCPFCVVGDNGSFYRCNILFKTNFDACIGNRIRIDCPLIKANK